MLCNWLYIGTFVSLRKEGGKLLGEKLEGESGTLKLLILMACTFLLPCRLQTDISFYAKPNP